MNNTPWWQVAALFGGIGILVGLLIGMAIGWRMDSSLIAHGGNDSNNQQATTTGSSNTTMAANPDDLSVKNQASGKAVLVAHVTLPTLGWVAVHEVLNGETMGNVLGASRLEAGSHDNVVVNLLRGTEPNKQYAVILYADNGNKQFDLHADMAVEATDGNPIVARFTTEMPNGAAGQ